MGFRVIPSLPLNQLSLMPNGWNTANDRKGQSTQLLSVLFGTSNYLQNIYNPVIENINYCMRKVFHIHIYIAGYYSESETRAVFALIMIDNGTVYL